MEAIKVLIRVRPIVNSGHHYTSVVQVSPDNKAISIDANRQIQCRYDHVFGPKSSQSDVYLHTKYVVEAVLNGFNGTIFAYGQTGSGKSHSMFGMDGSIRLQPGIVPRCVKDLFQGLKSSPRSNISSVYVSFLQVYNEQVFDMFSKGPMISLSIREKNCDVFVSNLKQYRTQSFDQCIKLIEAGLENRAIRETTMNHASSRSHSILQIVVEQDMFENNECKRICSKLNLVDLAGSERWGVNGMGDEQISELTNINSSLHTLGRCVAALARTSRHEQGTVQGPNKNIHIPFRDSKLTRLLQDSLGGNAKTCLLATINPSLTCGDESICTLRFADCAHQVRERLFPYLKHGFCFGSKIFINIHAHVGNDPR